MIDFCTESSFSQWVSRTSHPEVFCKKGVLENFAKFTGKHLCQSLFFNKIAGLRPLTLLKKRLWLSRFSVNFGKFLRAPYFREHLGGCFRFSVSIVNVSLSSKSTHSLRLVSLYTSWKYRKNRGFLMFSWSIEINQ